MTYGELLYQVDSYVHGQIDLDAFLDWFVMPTPSTPSSDAFAQRLANEIEAEITSFQGGSLDENQLRVELVSVLNIDDIRDNELPRKSP